MKQGERVEVVEYTDVMCSWAWGSEAKLRRLRWRYEDRCDWRLVMGGLVGDRTRQPDWNPKEQAARGFAAGLCRRIEAARAGEEFDSLVLVAPPKFLGYLRDGVSEATRDRLVAERRIAEATQVAAVLPRVDHVAHLGDRNGAGVPCRDHVIKVVEAVQRTRGQSRVRRLVHGERDLASLESEAGVRSDHWRCLHVLGPPSGQAFLLGQVVIDLLW